MAEPRAPPEWLPARSTSPFASPELQKVAKDTQLGVTYNDSLAERLSRSLTAASKRGQRLTARMVGRAPRAGSLSVSVPSTAPSTQHSTSSSGVDPQHEEAEGPPSPLQAGLRKLQQSRRSPGLARPMAAPAAPGASQALYNPATTSSWQQPVRASPPTAGAVRDRHGAAAPLHAFVACDSPTADWVAASSHTPSQPRLPTRPHPAAAAEEAALYHQLAVQSAEGRYAEARVLADLAHQDAESALQEVQLLSRLAPGSPAAAAPAAAAAAPWSPKHVPGTSVATPGMPRTSSSSSGGGNPFRQPSTSQAAAAGVWGAPAARPSSSPGHLRSHRLMMPTVEEEEETGRSRSPPGGIVFPAAAAGSSVRAAAAQYEQQVWQQQQQQQQAATRSSTGATSSHRRRWFAPAEAAAADGSHATPVAAPAVRQCASTAAGAGSWRAPEAAASSSRLYPQLPTPWVTRGCDTAATGAHKDTATAPAPRAKPTPAAGAAATSVPCRPSYWQHQQQQQQQQPQQQQQYASKYYPPLDSIPTPGVNTANITAPAYLCVGPGVLLQQGKGPAASPKAPGFPAASMAHYDADVPPMPDRWVQQPCAALQAVGEAIADKYHSDAAQCFPVRAAHAYPSCPPA
jgi:hypothetical protein